MFVFYRYFARGFVIEFAELRVCLFAYRVGACALLSATSRSGVAWSASLLPVVATVAANINELICVYQVYDLGISGIRYNVNTPFHVIDSPIIYIGESYRGHRSGRVQGFIRASSQTEAGS